MPTHLQTQESERRLSSFLGGHLTYTEQARWWDCPNPERWSAPDQEATETEVSEFLGGLVKALRPDYVIETGAYKGFTTKALGAAVAPWGHVDALEIRHEYRGEVATEACKDLPVTIHTIAALDFVPRRPIDFVFFDSDMQSRKDEMTYFYPYVSSRCVWAIHDSRDDEVQALLQELQQSHVITGFVNLPTPRGITIGRYLKGD